ncbi:MAG: NUDIX hydrolase [Stenomitos rutilans HA7619-LM2]|nr:NUDIX hydrolase [Stenomitos rutilans HA7619-LM2]
MDISQEHRHKVAIVILHQNGHFLLQLRDDIPGILYPGHWALFGGHLEPGEHPDEAIRRELVEEISYAPAMLTPFGFYEDIQVVRCVYQGVLDVDLSQLVLKEGWDMALASVEDIRRGDRYSHQANQTRPLGKPHQRILLDFIEGSALRPHH